jgi:protein-S-isoprenylcysteine O-methyltransferase Ste14
MSSSPGRIGRLAVAVVCYVVAMVPMGAFMLFLADLPVPWAIDSGPARPFAAAVDGALVVAFAGVHSLLARGAAKRRLARIVGDELERPVYSAIAGLQMMLLMAVWRPLPEPVWSFDSPAARASLWTLYALGWALALAGAWVLGTTRLYGLTPVWERFRGRTPKPVELELGGPYRFVRHPLYAGTLLALWAAPTMSEGRALLAALFTAYILVGMRFEERDLDAAHGERFAAYRRDVGTFLPRWRRSSKATDANG